MSDEERRATAIVFFTLDGKEISRIPIPTADLDGIWPAQQPVLETAEQSE